MIIMDFPFSGALALPTNIGPSLKRSRLRSLLLAGTALVSGVAGATALAGGPAPLTLPSGGRVTAGQVSITQSGGAMTVTQASSKAVLDWQSFDIGSQASVVFRQPDASSMALNRVVAGDASQIQGRLSANGQVVLINPNGVVFGPGAAVNVGGLVASALDIKDADFLAGNFSFERGQANGAVANHGAIRTAPGGYAALVGAKVTNDGLIEASLGTVALASGEAAVLSFTGTSLVGVQVRPATIASLIEAGGIIRADGGKVLVSAAAANQILGGAINADGVIEANSLSNVGGRISLQASGPITIAGAEIAAMGASGGGAIAVGGTSTAQVTVDTASRLDASATAKGDGGSVLVNSQATAFHGQATARGGAKGGNGGHVETSGEHLDVSGARVDVAAPLGGRGSWLLDPTDFIVDASNAGAIQSGLASADVTIQTTASGNSVSGATAVSGANGGANGDIVVAAPITWASNQTLTLNAYHSVLVQAPVSASGDTAGLTINAGRGQFYTGTGGSVTLSGANPSLSINGDAYSLIGSAAQFQAMATDGTYALAKDIDLSQLPSAFLPIGYTAAGHNANPTPFTGMLEGLGHSISHLVINDATDSNLGLISNLGGTVRNLTIAAGSVAAGANVSNIGMVAGQSSGNIVNVTAGGSVSTGDHATNVGGLVGRYSSGTVSFGAFSGSVVAGAAASNIGGLVGQIDGDGLVISSYSKGSATGGSGSSNIGGLAGNNAGYITASFSAANVTAGSGAKYIGGLVGQSSAQILSNYATGNVIAGDGASDIGGLVGLSGTGLNFGYATGSVSGGANAAYIGGLIGYCANGNVAAAYATGAVSGGAGATSLGGLIGYNFQTNIGQEQGANGSSINTLYWNVTGTGQGSAFGTQVQAWTAASAPVGLTAAMATDIKNYPGFDSLASWFSGNNGAPALLASPFVLKVTPANQTATYGAAVPTFTAKLTGFWAGDAVNEVGGLALASTAGATPSVGSYAITASGASLSGQNGNIYQFKYNTGTLTIKQAPLTITANDAGKTYGDDFSPAANAFTSTTLYNGDSITGVAMFTPGSAVTANAGSYPITASAAAGSGLGNYAITYKAGSLTVNKAPLVITADNQSMSYGGTLPALSASYSGFVNGDTTASLTQAATVASSVPATAGTGSFPGALVASGAAAANYAISYVPGTLTIGKAQLIITANDAAMTYGGTLPALGVSYSGFVNGDTASSLTQLATVASSVAATSGAGIYPKALAASGASTANYDIRYVPGTLTIGKAALVVTANDAGMTYGGTLPALGARYSGLVNGDTPAGLVQPASVVSTVPPKANVGTYAAALVASGVVLPNYDVSYVPGALTIDRAQLVITANDAAKTYGRTASLAGTAFTAGGLVNADSVTAVGMASAGAAATAGAGSYAITPSAAVGSGLANYAISYVSGRLTVDRASLTWSVADATATSGGPLVLPPAVLTGVVGQDQVTGVVGLSNGLLPVTPSARLPAGSYTETVTGLDGSAAGNYQLAAAGNRSGRLTVFSNLTGLWPALLAQDNLPPAAQAQAVALPADRLQLAAAASDEIFQCEDLEDGKRLVCKSIRRQGAAEDDQTAASPAGGWR